MNNRTLYTVPMLCLLIGLYTLVFYLIVTYQRVVDFTSFYISIKSLMYNINPYPISKTIPANLNPPFFLFVFYPLGLFSYKISIIIWSILSLALNFIAAHLAFIYIFSEAFRKKYELYLYLLYFSFFPVLMDTSIVQVGSILFFFIMLGYHFYLRQHDYWAGIFWGFIISLKLFPALLFFFVLKQGRYKVFLIMLATFLSALLIPLLFSDLTIYKQYLTMMAVIYWYGDSWNASIYGYIFRLYVDLKNPGHTMLPATIYYLIAFFTLLAGYFLAMGKKEITGEANQINHQPFCLTLTMMLFLSPFGWLYYFSLLIFPLMLIASYTFEGKNKALLLAWVACFFLINFPQAYVLGKHMQTFTQKIGLHSFSFYGLLLLNMLVIYWRKMPGENTPNLLAIKEDEIKYRFVTMLFFYLLFGLIVPLNSFLIRVSIGGAGNYDIKNLFKLIH